VLLGIWKRIGKKEGVATVTCSQLADDPVVKNILVRGHRCVLNRLKVNGFITPTRGSWSLTPLGREVCRLRFDG
jgi:hypothetical protein